MLTSIAAVVKSVEHDQTREWLVSVLTDACETAREKWDGGVRHLQELRYLRTGRQRPI